MKRRILFLTIIVALALITLSSCLYAGIPLEELSGKTQAYEVQRRADEKISGADSYTAAIELSLQTTVSGKSVRATATGAQMVSGQGTDDFMLETDVKYDITGASSYTLRTGYCNGKMFSEYYGLPRNVYLCSSISRNDYLGYLRDIGDDYSHFALSSDAKEAKAEALEDGGWRAVFSNFGSRAIAAYSDSFNAEEIFENAVISDMIMTVTTDSELYYRSVAIDFIFEAADDEGASPLPTASITISFHYINDTEVNKRLYEEHTEVEDLRILTKLADAFDEVYEKQSGGFKLTTKINVKNTQNSFTEIAEGRYSIKPGGVNYTINALYEKDPYDEKSEYLIEYSDEKRVVTYVIEDPPEDMVNEGKETESDDYTERRYIKGILNPGGFTYYMAESVEKNEDGSYTLELLPSNALMNSLTSLGVSGEAETVKYTIRLNFWGDLSYVKAEIETNYSYINLGGATYRYNGITIVSECEYK